MYKLLLETIVVTSDKHTALTNTILDFPSERTRQAFIDKIEKHESGFGFEVFRKAMILPS